jgi:hypothetical protein
MQIIPSTSASAGNYDWTVLNTPSNQCKVRISDASNSSISDISDNTFFIRGIKITAPNGGEYWVIKAKQNITFTSGGITNVKIEYSTNNGTNWATVIATTPASSGSYNWTIPEPPSDNCKVRISDVTDTTANSISANVFKIVLPKITIVSPNGGENWKVDSTYSIKWTYNDVTNAKIEYTTNSGTNWLPVFASTPASSGSYNWTIPYTPSNQCKVRISDVTDTTINGKSANVFTIAVVPKVTIVSPNGGEIWKVGETDTLKWTYKYVTNIKIEYTTDNEASWSTIIVSTPASSGSYPWTVLNTPSNQCKVRISDAIDPTVFSKSANIFNIVVRKIVVKSPNGGENWYIGKIDTIMWTNDYVNNAKLEYTTNNGTGWTTIISSTPASSGSYPWTVLNTPSNQCEVRISDVSNSSISDTSDNTFTISEQPSISVTSPIAGSVWVVGTQQTVKWSTINVAGNVNIKLSTNGGYTFPIQLTGNTPNDSSEVITIPNDTSSNCRVLVESNNSTSVFGTNNGNFTIAIPSIKVTSPNGGEKCDTGTVYQITWESKYVAIVKIEYSINNGVSWVNIDSSYTSPGIFNWKVPNTPSEQCKIKISDTSNGSWYDESDSLFIIRVPVPTGIRELLSSRPAQFNLYQNFPNPFNPVSRIYYSVPTESHVVIKLYNALGQEIRMLVNETKPVGNYWVNIDGSHLKSGVYIYHMNAGQFTQTKKMILMK